MHNYPKLLLVEDDQNLASTIASLLSKEFSTDVVRTAKTARKKLTRSSKYDLLLIDIMLPDKDGATGLDLCKYIRKSDTQTPILILTGKAAINYKLGAFNFGADDYLVKPFNMLELRARIKTLLKRSKKNFKKALREDEKGQIILHDLHLNHAAYLVKRKDHQITLRKKEFALLEHLLANAGRVFSRESLIRDVWDDQEIEENTVDVHIKNLRDKIDAPFDKKLIKTVYGVGYKIE